MKKKRGVEGSFLAIHLIHDPQVLSTDLEDCFQAVSTV